MSQKNEEEVVVDIASDRKRHFIISGILATAIIGLIAALGAGLKLDPNAQTSALIQKPAKPFQVSWMQGKELMVDAQQFMTLDDYKGKPLILNFWASWCVSCKQEAKLLEYYWQKYKDMGVQVVGIAIQDTPENALRFAKFYGKTYILGLDEDGKAGIDYGVTAVPETFFINKEGIIIHKEAGPIHPQLMDEMVPKILN